MLETAYMLFISYLFGEIDMFYKIKKYNKVGEMIGMTSFAEKDYPDHHPSHARYQAVEHFEDTIKETAALYRILKSDKARKNWTDAQLKSHYDNAVAKIEYQALTGDSCASICTHSMHRWFLDTPAFV